MFVMRPIKPNDFDSYANLAFSAHLGMLSLPKNGDKLKKNLELSLKSFSSPANLNQSAFYLFVLENLDSKQIGGVCGIYSSIGSEFPHYYYQKKCHHLKPFSPLPLTENLHLLHPVAINNGPSEICSLYLTKNFRKEGLGKLLSLNRFLFIANFPDRFKEEIIAEMRGFTNKDNTNPFWEHVGKKFLPISYSELIKIQHQGLEFVSHTLPEHPLYIELLPQEAQEAIGKIHEHTHPAWNILLKEGFKPADLYDVFDVGPILKAKTKEIRSIKQSCRATFKDRASNITDSLQYIVSNDSIDFRACMSEIQFITPEEALLPPKTINALNLNPGDTFRYLSFM